MQLIEPIIIANYTEQLVLKTRPSIIIDLMVQTGWSKDHLKHRQVFELALRTVINQVKYN